MTRCFIGLGSNLGDRAVNLQNAYERIGSHPDCECIGISPYYDTTPMGPQNQPDFLNAACEIYTSLTPHELLSLCKSIEAEMGRTASERWGPRIIDLDILLYGNLVLNTERLSIPHPGMMQRSFVLKPLAALCPGLIPPGFERSIQEQLDRL